MTRITDHKERKKVGKAMRLARERRGIKQGYVAEQIGVDSPTLARMEQGGWGNWTKTVIRKWQKFLDVKVVA